MLFKKIKEDQLTARKNKDTYTANALTSILGEISRKVSNQANVLDEHVHQAVKTIINGLEKGIKDKIEHTGNDNGMEQFKEDIKFFSQFLPKGISDEEVKNIVAKFKAENPLADFPAAMKHFKTFIGMNMKLAGDLFKGK